MNFRPYLLLLAVSLSCFAACARKEKAVLDLRSDEKVIEVKQDEVRLDEAAKDNVTARQSSQTARQKMSDNSEITVMYDGYGNKLEKRYFKGNPRLTSVLIRTAADGRREILVYGQNGEKRTIDGEIADRLLSAPADEIANAAKLYETPSIYRNRKLITQNQQPKPQTPVTTIVTPPVATEQPETTVQESTQETPKTSDSNENPELQKEQVKDREPGNKENK
ncbi:MAG TPA: hypothetical protein VF721_22045 [Pyrinomonadaceae bacterium]|jgi:hypothetical protein